jgi:hypothetical protein
MMAIAEVSRWLATLPANGDIAIDDGGLSLVLVAPPDDTDPPYLEVGGLPDNDDDWESAS